MNVALEPPCLRYTVVDVMVPNRQVAGSNPSKFVRCHDRELHGYLKTERAQKVFRQSILWNSIFLSCY
jgi:hypothetical protein